MIKNLKRAQRALQREGLAAWAKSARADLLRARLTALGGSALPGRDPATGRPATASGARASRLQSPAHSTAPEPP
eukprot:scaffold49187_cov44-Phaeocystis_antarctica.AAC.2